MKKTTIPLLTLGALFLIIFLATDMLNFTEVIVLLSFLGVFDFGVDYYNEGKKKTGGVLLSISIFFTLFILTGVPLGK